MSTNLPATIPSVDAAVAAMKELPSAQRTKVRGKALGGMLRMLDVLTAIAEESKSDNARVAAVKVYAAIAAVTNTTSIPRDVVLEKLKATVHAAEGIVPDDRWDEYMKRVAPLWSDV